MCGGQSKKLQNEHEIDRQYYRNSEMRHELERASCPRRGLSNLWEFLSLMITAGINKKKAILCCLILAKQRDLSQQQSRSHKEPVTYVPPQPYNYGGKVLWHKCL